MLHGIANKQGVLMSQNELGETRTQSEVLPQRTRCLARHTHSIKKAGRATLRTVGALAGVLFALAGCGNGSKQPDAQVRSEGGRGNASLADKVPVELMDDANLRALEMASKFNCEADVLQSSMAMKKVYIGAISYQKNGLHAFTEMDFETPLPAMKALYQFTCMNREKRTKGALYVGVFEGWDGEFSTPRCVLAKNITVYGSDGNTPTGAIEPFVTQVREGNQPYADATFEQACGFKQELVLEMN